MKYTLLNEQFPFKNGPPRSGGLHLTDITRDMYLTILHGRDNSTDNNLWAEPGYLWEELLEWAYAKRNPHRIGEITLDGITGSPDGMDWENWVLYEDKFTWRSTKKEPMDDERWMMQVKGYCKMLGTCKVKMRVFYCMGDYRGSGPQYKVYELYFTQREVDEHWEGIVNHAKWKGWL